MGLKQVIAVRRDLQMPPGKLAVQVAHAAMVHLVPVVVGERDANGNGITDEELEWIAGSMAKVVVGVDDEAELLALISDAFAAGILVGMIKDEGRTVFNKPTLTCAAFGPHEAGKLDPLTRKLRLY